MGRITCGKPLGLNAAKHRGRVLRRSAHGNAGYFVRVRGDFVLLSMAIEGWRATRTAPRISVTRNCLLANGGFGKGKWRAASVADFNA